MRQAAAPVGLALAGAAVALLWDSTAGTAVAFALFGVACVVAVSLVFLAVGRSENAERAERTEPKPPPHDNERPALKRGRKRPPRRPS